MFLMSGNLKICNFTLQRVWNLSCCTLAVSKTLKWRNETFDHKKTCYRKVALFHSLVLTYIYVFEVMCLLNLNVTFALSYSVAAKFNILSSCTNRHHVHTDIKTSRVSWNYLHLFWVIICSHVICVCGLAKRPKTSICQETSRDIIKLKPIAFQQLPLIGRFSFVFIDTKQNVITHQNVILQQTVITTAVKCCFTPH